MRLTVFGASGGTGSHLVRQALAAGHDVTAVARPSSQLPFEGAAGLTVVRAELDDPAEIIPAVEGRDVVFSALGPRGRGPTDICARGVAVIIKAMEAAGVTRLSVVSASGAFIDAGDGTFTRLVAKPILQRIFRESFADTRTMEAELKESGLDWTSVRPPRLLDGERTGRYRSAIGMNVRGGFKINRADVADYMLASMTDPATYRQVVGLGN